MDHTIYYWRPRDYTNEMKREQSPVKKKSSIKEEKQETNIFQRPFIPPNAENTNEAFHISLTSGGPEDSFHIKTNKREDITNNLASRDLAIQTCINPFLNTNYIDDLDIHEKFLKPKNTNL